jgi:glutamyl-tRNA reductase
VNIYAVGLNHRTAPVAIREKLSIRKEEFEELLTRLNRLPAVAECVLLSTCNRTEAYLYTENPRWDSTLIEREICSFKQLGLAEYKQYFYVYAGLPAVKHLYKVASGLDSLIWGEDQILGQVKQAFASSLACGVTGAVLNTLFREAITAAKALKNTIRQFRQTLSTAAAGIKTAQAYWEDRLENKNAVLIGSGAVGKSVLEELCAAGVAKVGIASRNRTKVAEIIAQYPRAFAFDYQERYRFINEADLVVSATASPHYTVTRDNLQAALSLSKQRVFIDLAVPRDLDDTIRELPGVICLNLDQLPGQSGSGPEVGPTAQLRLEQLLGQRVLQFEKWYAFRETLPLLRDIQASTANYIEATLAKLKSDNAAEREVVRRAMQGLANHLLNQCFYRARDGRRQSGTSVSR